MYQATLQPSAASCALALALLCVAALAVPAVAMNPGDAEKPETPVTFTPYDVSAITLYGDNAVYRPKLCPGNITFTERSRFLPELADNVIGIFPTDMRADGSECTADALMLRFTPIGRPDHLPPQWVFEDSTLSKHPVNFTCGGSRFSIRYAYFNDVKTPSGFLDPNVVYFDFAVIPNTTPFAFCSYMTRRSDGRRPIDYAPFPTRETWNTVKERDAGRPVPVTPSMPGLAAPSPETEEPMTTDEADDMTDEDTSVRASKQFSPTTTSLVAQLVHRAWSSW